MSDLLTSRVRPQSLVDVVTERLEAAIVGGELAPGARLSEQALAKSLGVSRGPLREAIRRLEGRKLLERTPNIGVRVAELSLGDLLDILTIREALEGAACGLAAQFMSDDEIDELDDLLKEHGRHEGIKGGTGYYQESRDFDFHFRIIKGSRNSRMIQMLCGDLYDLLRVYRYKSSTFRGRAKAAFAEHRQIVEALRSRDTMQAETKMREHIRNARRSVQARLDDTLDAKADLPAAAATPAPLPKTRKPRQSLPPAAA